MAWDLNKAIDHLQKKAEPPYGVGECAKYVRLAIAAGGITVNGTADAKDLGPNLVAAGFTQIPGPYPRFLPGDVAVIDGFLKTAAAGIKKDHPKGHVAMYDGSQWISDFIQTDAVPYPGNDYKLASPVYLIYRI